MEEKRKNGKKILIISIIVILLIIVGVSIFLLYMNSRKVNILSGKIDDWVYEGSTRNSSSLSTGSGIAQSSSTGSGVAPGSYEGSSVSAGSTASSSSSNIGFSTGGAKDVNNFRENIENGYFPISTDITYNGLFYDYTFDTGNVGNDSQELFSPSYPQDS